MFYFNLLAQLLLFVFFINLIETFDHWGYRNEKKKILPNNWHRLFENCLGSQQSPINILFNETEFDPNLKPIKIINTNDV